MDKKEVMQTYDRLSKRVAHEILRSTLPLFIVDGKPRYVGSAVMIKYREKVFIISAAHVLQDTPKPIFVPLDGDDSGYQLKMSKLYSTIVSPGMDRNSDKLDFAFYEVDAEEVERITHSYDILDPTHLPPDGLAKPHKLHLTCGYPESRVKKGFNYPEKNYQPSPFIYSSSELTQESIRSLGFTEQNVLVEYEHRVLDQAGQELPSPPPFGLSGSGLWFIDKVLNNNMEHPSFFLVGIQFDYPKGKKAVLVSTRIDTILRAIDREIFT